MSYYKKKSIIKKIFYGTLATATSIAMPITLHKMVNTDYEVYSEEKSKIVKEFVLSDDYEKGINQEEAEIMDKFMTGKIDYEQKEEQIKIINKESNAEIILKEYGNEEFNARVHNINQDLLKAGKESLKWGLCLISSGILAFGFGMKFLGYLDEYKYDKLVEDEELSNRVVIV